MIPTYNTKGNTSISNALSPLSPLSPVQALNQAYKLFQKKSKSEEKLMIADRSSDKLDTFYFRIIIEKA
jgi:hypothetical protein